MILRALLDQDDELNRFAGHITNTAYEHPYAVSLLTIGETLGLIAKERDADCCTEAGRELHRLVSSGKIDVRGFGSDGTCLALAGRILTLDDYLTPDDAMILAAALLDETSAGLYTTDGALLLGRRTKEIAREHGKWIRRPPGF